MEFEIWMPSTGHFLFPSWHILDAFLLLPQQRGDFHVIWPAWWPPYDYCRFLSLMLPPIFTYYSSFTLDDIVSASEIFHLAITEYCTLAVLRFLVLVPDGAVDYNCAVSRLCLWSRSDFVPWLTLLCTEILDYGSHHFMAGFLSTMPLHMSRFYARPR